MARVDVFDDIHWAFFFVKGSGLIFVETTATSHSLSCACCPLKFNNYILSLSFAGEQKTLQITKKQHYIIHPVYEQILHIDLP